jgi:hypothetical protein
MSTNPRYPEVRQHVSQALSAVDFPVGPGTIDAIATVGAGYIELQAGALAPLFPAISSNMVAQSMVELYRRGVRPSPPTKGIYRERFREIVDTGLEQRHMTWPDNEMRAALAALALSAWDENDLRGKRKPIGEYFVTLYSAGLD